MNKPSDRHKTKAIIFDFDGTLADSFPVFVRAVEFALKRQPFTTKEIEDLRQYSVHDVIKILKVKKWQLPWLVIKGNQEIDRHQDDITVFQGVPEALQELSRAGYKLYVVSTHSEKGIKLFLKKYQLSECIDHVFANVGLFGKPKGLKKLQNKFDFVADECIFVGDEVRDIEAAHKVGMRCIVVTWGFNTAESLKAHDPSGIVDKPTDLMRAVRSLE